MPMPVLRTTELIGAPPSVVLAALCSPDVRGRRNAAGVRSCGPGDPAGFPVPLPRMRVTRLDADGLSARGAARFDARVSGDPAGTVLACELDWPSPGGVLLRPVLARALSRFVARVRAVAVRLSAAQVVVGAAVLRDGRVLAQQRRYPARDAGRWELPGGRVEPGESDVDALCRECAEELGVGVRADDPLGVDVALPGGALLRVYSAVLTTPEAVPEAREHRAVRWLAPSELSDVDWLDADRVLLGRLRELLCFGAARDG